MALSRRLRWVLLLAALLFPAGAARAADPLAEGQLHDVRGRLSDAESRRRTVSEDLAEWTRKARELEAQSSENRRKIERLLTEREVLLEARLVAADRVDEALTATRERRDLAARRSAALYRVARLGSSRRLAQGAEATDSLRLARYLAAVARADMAVIDEHTRLVAERRERLAHAEADERAAADEIVALDSDIPRLDAEAQHAQTTMQQLRQELAVQAVELDRLRTSETRLRAAVVAAQAPAPEEPREVAALDRAVRLPDPPEPAREAAVAARPGGAATTAAQAPEAGGARAGETEERPGLLARLFGLGRRERVEEAPPTAETPTPAPRPDANEAFEKRRGALRAPASGRILARFGDRHTTGAVYKAVVVRTVPAASVRAVASGEVVYSGSFPGIGNTVIVAHGGRYHTVYGRLGSIRRDVGARVAEGDVVGTMGPADTDLHFEVRSEGRSVDPLPWLGGGAGAFGG